MPTKLVNCKCRVSISDMLETHGLTHSLGLAGAAEFSARPDHGAWFLAVCHSSFTGWKHFRHRPKGPKLLRLVRHLPSHAQGQCRARAGVGQALTEADNNCTYAAMLPACAYPASRRESISEQFSTRPSQQSASKKPTSSFTMVRFAE